MSESLLRARHSARSFKNQEIDTKLIKDIIAEAQWAPSWCNSQPWKAYVLTGEAAKKMHESHHTNVMGNKKSWTEVVPPQFTDKDWSAAEWTNMRDFWQAGDVSPFPEDGSTDKLGFNKESAWDFHAPAIVYITIPKNATMFSAYDAGAFGYGITLAAREQGVDCIPAYEFIRYPQEIRQVIDIPEDEAIFMGIGLGYAQENEDLNRINEFEKHPRAKTDDILQIVK
ncbi:nitroreductase [Secundilactobacillus mixtipabuli]|uniref:Nitroreductase n=1 Tax=Secundilactobacillus mixtipabuli TaxID=1435342 RepID=A0A1Z5I9N6_9LACO|nr:nitroreductase [Secundilactobacillus mixtipabuli]GAW98493.1 nitroreductase [Secundilactobacillus mixtipabuli]